MPAPIGYTGGVMGRPPKPADEKSVPRNFRLTPAAFAAIVALADRWGCSHSEAITRAVDAALELADWPMKED